MSDGALPAWGKRGDQAHPASQSLSEWVSEWGLWSHSRGTFKSSGTEREGRNGKRGGSKRIDRFWPPSLSSFTITFVENLSRAASTAVHAYSIKIPAGIFLLSFSSVVPLTYSISISLSLHLHWLSPLALFYQIVPYGKKFLHLKKLWWFGKILIYYIIPLCCFL